MYEENGKIAQKIYWTEDEAANMKAEADAMGLTPTEYVKFAARAYRQRKELEEIVS